MSTQFFRRNHSVPEAYLKGWSPQPGRVWAYRLLVPRQDYPLWKLRWTNSLARYDHLYTSSFKGVDSDVYERWLNEEIEQPAHLVLEKVRADEVIGDKERRTLGLYAAALDLRTPISYQQHAERCNRELPGLLRDTAKHMSRKIRELKSGEFAHSSAPLPPEELGFPMKCRIEDADGGGKAMRMEVVIGRELWLWDQRRMLTQLAPKFAGHSWCILRPHPGSEWFTSDRPLIRLNFFDLDNYDFGGGWGWEGTELIVPLSPQHLMYAKVGTKSPPCGTASLDETVMFQRVIAEHAHRWIISKGRPQRALAFRPRVVNLTAFNEERKFWQDWHEAHRKAENGPAEMISSNSDVPPGSA